MGILTTSTDINGGAHNNELERVEFEHWAEEAGALPWGSLKKRRIGEGYSAQIYNYMWHAWRARSQLEPA